MLQQHIVQCGTEYLAYQKTSNYEDSQVYCTRIGYTVLESSGGKQVNGT
jgi:ribosomal protein S27E